MTVFLVLIQEFMNVFRYIEFRFLISESAILTINGIFICGYFSTRLAVDSHYFSICEGVDILDPQSGVKSTYEK